MNLKDVAWVEKYRPSSVNDIVGDFKEKIKTYLEKPKSIPNFLFYSRTPGTGKTTLAKAIINDLGCDSLTINASDDRTLEVVRTKIKDFAKTVSTNGMKKCIFLDEFDGNLKATQEALRNLMETYSSNAFFILTANNLTKVIEPIQSRCITIQFKNADKNDISNRLKYIAENESMKYTDDGINKLIDLNYPSIRNCINTMQDLYISKKSLTPENILSFRHEFELIWDYMLNGNYNEIKMIILQFGLDCEELNRFLFQKTLDSSLPLKNEIGMIQKVAKIERDIKNGADSTIIMVSMIQEFINELRQ
jgi:replication factor C small subunit